MVLQLSCCCPKVGLVVDDDMSSPNEKGTHLVLECVSKILQASTYLLAGPDTHVFVGTIEWQKT